MKNDKKFLTKFNKLCVKYNMTAVVIVQDEKNNLYISGDLILKKHIETITSYASELAKKTKGERGKK